MSDDLTKQTSSTTAALVGATAIAFALLVPTVALAQSRTYYGADGRVQSRVHTGTDGSTVFYGADGRVIGRSTTSPSGTTTLYGSDGRKAGSITTTPKREPRR